MSTSQPALTGESRSAGRQALALLLFGAVTAAAAWSGSVITAGVVESEWFRQLEKPAFYPPDAAFGIVWTLLYVMIAAAGWLAWRAGGGMATTVPWSVQLALNLAWTAVFFGARAPAWALVEIVVLLVAIVWTMAAFRRYHRWATLLFVPYALWTGFATVLNASIVVIN